MVARSGSSLEWRSSFSSLIPSRDSAATRIPNPSLAAHSLARRDLVVGGPGLYVAAMRGQSSGALRLQQI